MVCFFFHTQEENKPKPFDIFQWAVLHFTSAPSRGLHFLQCAAFKLWPSWTQLRRQHVWEPHNHSDWKSGWLFFGNLWSIQERKLHLVCYCSEAPPSLLNCKSQTCSNHMWEIIHFHHILYADTRAKEERKKMKTQKATKLSAARFHRLLIALHCSSHSHQKADFSPKAP